MAGLKPEVSVIMPIFNGACFLDRALRSVISQTYKNWELLAVDDGSRDNSYQLLCMYAKFEPRIRPQRLARNCGPSAARNHALRQAQGQMIAYLDCDDEYYPDYLDYVHRCRDKADVLVFSYDAIDDDGLFLQAGEIRTWEPSILRKALLFRNVACPLGVAHRRELVEKAGLFDESVGILEDWELWRRFAMIGAEFIYLLVKSGLYHIRATSQSRIGGIRI